MTELVALLCVAGIAGGQMLFKFGADALAQGGGKLWSTGGAVLAAAVVLYAATTVVWIWVLQRAELSKIYPLMALSYVLVPVGSYFVFGETIGWRYALGCGLIVAGVVLTSRA